MLRVVWKWRATVLLVLIVSVGVCGLSGPSDEDDCAGARIIKESGMAYYCLLSARAFTNINSPNGPAQASPASAVPLAFEQNLGQADRRYQFLAHSTAGSVYLSRGGVDLDI